MNVGLTFDFCIFFVARMAKNIILDVNGNIAVAFHRRFPVIRNVHGLNGRVRRRATGDGSHPGGQEQQDTIGGC